MKTTLRHLPLLAAFFAGAVTWHLSAGAVKDNVGQQLPELKLSYVGDKPDLAGKAVLIEFWATWCEPCRENIPHLNELWKTYKDKGLVVLGVSKEEEAPIKEFMKETPMHYFIGRDPASELAALFGITVIPHALLVDKTGKIVWEGHPELIKAADIEEVLK